MLLPVAACVASAGFAVTGACLRSTAPPPDLHAGTYVLLSINGRNPPVTVTDSAARQLRVIADTIQLSTGAHTYAEHATVAITPPGGTEQPPGPLTVGTRSYTVPSTGMFDLPVTITGLAHGIVTSDNSIDLRLPDASHWVYTLR